MDSSQEQTLKKTEKRVIRKTQNNAGDACKTYIYNHDNCIEIHKITLIKGALFDNMLGGETIVRKGDGYILTLHWFTIKKSTLLSSLQDLGIIQSIHRINNIDNFTI